MLAPVAAGAWCARDAPHHAVLVYRPGAGRRLTLCSGVRRLLNAVWAGIFWLWAVVLCKAVPLQLTSAAVAPEHM